MHVISRKRLKLFCDRIDGKNALVPLDAWWRRVKRNATVWRSWSDIKADYPTASKVGRCVVFDIGGNKFRLVTHVEYRLKKVFVLKVMTHREYDNDRWKDECHCI